MFFLGEWNVDGCKENTFVGFVRTLANIATHLITKMVSERWRIYSMSFNGLINYIFNHINKLMYLCNFVLLKQSVQFILIVVDNYVR